MKAIKLAQEWLKKLNTRERYFVLVGGGIALLLVCYYLILSPFFSTKQALQQKVQENRALLQWLQAAQDNLQQLQTQQTPPTRIKTSDSLATIVNDTLKQQQLSNYAQQIAVPNPNQVNIIFNEVPFDNVLQWSILLWQQYGIHVIALSATPQNMPGTVQLNMTVGK